MKFFIDENLSPRLRDPLHVFYPQHRFRTFVDEGLQGLDDIEVLRHIGGMGFDGIITQDAMQLVRADERQALIDNDVHWVGILEAADLGRLAVPATTSAIFSGMQHVVTNWQPTPSIYRIECHPSVARRPTIEEL